MHPIFMETILILKIAYVFTVQKHTTLYLIVYSTAMTTLEALTGHINIFYRSQAEVSSIAIIWRHTAMQTISVIHIALFLSGGWMKSMQRT
jgi:hypothetical protein